MGTGFTLRHDSDIFDNTMLLGMGFGFLAIFLIPLVYERRTHWWPLIPGSVLILISIRQADDIVHYLFTKGWPLILVIIGVMILLGAFGRSRRGQTVKKQDGGPGATP